jgi:uncharacterized protein YkwD
MSWLKKILKLLKPKKKPRPDPVPAPPLPVPPANDLVDAINVQRAAHSLPPLRADARLMRAAEEWAEAMAANQVLDHGNFAGHRRNILGAFNAVGVGRAVARNGAVYWVADMASL